MTEKEAEQEKDDEIDDLLDFAQNLDFDEFIDDLEVKSLVSALKHRVNQMSGQEIDKKEK